MPDILSQILEAARDLLLEVDALILSYLILGNSSFPSLGQNVVANLSLLFPFAVILLILSLAINFFTRLLLKKKPLYMQIAGYALAFVLLTLFLIFRISS